MACVLLPGTDLYFWGWL